MKPIKQFSIPFTGLKIGKHQFDFEVDNNFFDAFEYSLIKKGILKVEVELDKQETMILLNFKISGTVELNCDTCLSDFTAPLEIQERQIVKFTEDDLESDDPEIIMLNKKESAVDVSSLIYEYINVSVPYIVNCGKTGQTAQCDMEMIAKLESFAIENKKENNDADPRWEALKNLK
ncbi:MAG: DUF177 domain-containing protein [Sphingobacteriales bacterium]|nr:MAG: DUF177 domain-containing protein [Sphingobacteriales bacterium]